MEKSLAIPGGAGRLLLVPSSDGYCTAVVAEREDGTEAWGTYPPDGDKDAWVSVRIDDGMVLATSFSGWVIRLDPESGREIERHFTK